MSQSVLQLIRQKVERRPATGGAEVGSGSPGCLCHLGRVGVRRPLDPCEKVCELKETWPITIIEEDPLELK